MYYYVEKLFLSLIDLLVPLLAFRILFDLTRSLIFRFKGVAMRDVLYISDIDNNFHYVDFSDDCILLYNQPSAEKNDVVECYKIYYKISPDTYKKTYETMQEDTTFSDYKVSNSFWARKDIGQFSLLLLTVFFIGIFLINIITSCVKKGGLFGGLL